MNTLQLALADTPATPAFVTRYDRAWAYLLRRDPATAAHSERATRLAVRIGRAACFSAAELAALRQGGLMHDFGKLLVPARVLCKPASLTPVERAIVRRHPVFGSLMAKILGLNLSAGASAVVRYHHERWDGAGYPDGLAGSQIPLLARAYAIADAFDALTGRRPYRTPLTTAAAVAQLYSEAGAAFDPDLFAAFLQVISPASRGHV